MDQAKIVSATGAFSEQRVEPVTPVEQVLPVGVAESTACVSRGTPR